MPLMPKNVENVRNHITEIDINIESSGWGVFGSQTENLILKTGLPHPVSLLKKKFNLNFPMSFV